jgi:hypothetical protein
MTTTILTATGSPASTAQPFDKLPAEAQNQYIKQGVESPVGGSYGGFTACIRLRLNIIGGNHVLVRVCFGVSSRRPDLFCAPVLCVEIPLSARPILGKVMTNEWLWFLDVLRAGYVCCILVLAVKPGPAGPRLRRLRA